MSMYIGEDNNGVNLLHITNGVTPQSSIKTGQILSNTVFHSSLPYLEVEEYECTVNIIRNDGMQQVLEIIPEIKFLNDVGDKGFFYTLNGQIPNVLTGCYVISNWSSSYTNFLEHPHTAAYRNSPSNTYNKLYYSTNWFDVPDSRYSVPVIARIYLLKNITADGVITPIPKNNEIKIMKNNINVRGISLTDFQYIAYKKVNDVDRVINRYRQSQASLQVLNTLNTSPTPTITLYSDPSETKIEKNGHRLFSSLYGSNALFSHWEEKYIPDAVVQNASVNFETNFYDFLDGDIICISIKVHQPGSGWRTGDLGILVFSQGDILISSLKERMQVGEMTENRVERVYKGIGSTLRILTYYSAYPTAEEEGEGNGDTVIFYPTTIRVLRFHRS